MALHLAIDLGAGSGRAIFGGEAWTEATRRYREIEEALRP